MRKMHATAAKPINLPRHECNKLFFSAQDRKKIVISMSILIHIYAEMNLDANEQNGIFMKQVPWLHQRINRHHPEEHQNPSRMSMLYIHIWKKHKNRILRDNSRIQYMSRCCFFISYFFWYIFL